ncbi:MAG: hypothetical protein IKW83_07395 [Muribaculaceae bacterium]|nr:hypothetical protein [Muribaculaceae bacterium]
MIARRLRKRIDPTSKDISIQVSYGTSDVRDTLKKMYDLFATPCGHTFAISQPVYEPELLSFFENTIFKEYESATAKELSRWAVTQAIKREFVITGTAENAFYLSPDLKKRAGRPKVNAEG